MQKSKATNLALASLLADATNPIPKACWRNSLNAMLYMRMANMHLGEQVRYVEGVTLIRVGSCDIPIEHGWLEVSKQVVDVTLCRDNLEGSRYHAVHRYDYDDVMDGISKSAMLPLYGSDQERRKEFLLAYFSVLDKLDTQKEEEDVCDLEGAA